MWSEVGKRERELAVVPQLRARLDVASNGTKYRIFEDF